MYNCDKCGYKFKSQYLLSKHINRKYPCTVIFECVKCKVVFNAKHILVNHMKRKTSCIDIVEVTQNTEMIRLELENRKLNIRERELDIKEKELESKKEIIELKKLAFIEKNTCIEKLKTERKEKTSIVVNNNNTINITNNYIQHIKDKYPDNYDITAFKESLENTYGELTQPFDLKPFELMLRFYDNYTDYKSLFNNIMEHAFHDDISKCLFYFKDLDKFFGLYKEGYETDIRETNFDSELKDICEEFIEKIIDFIANHIEYYRDRLDTDKQMSLLSSIAMIKKGYGGTRNLSAKFFEEII